MTVSGTGESTGSLDILMTMWSCHLTCNAMLMNGLAKMSDLQR